MAMHTMTPARRAALRKAQLASAAKRRKYGVGYAAKRGATRGFQRGAANASAAFHSPSNRAKFKKGAKRIAKTGAVAAAGTALAVGAYGAGLGYSKYRKEGASRKYSAQVGAVSAYKLNQAVAKGAGSGVKRLATRKKVARQAAMRRHPAFQSNYAGSGKKGLRVASTNANPKLTGKRRPNSRNYIRGVPTKARRQGFNVYPNKPTPGR